MRGSWLVVTLVACGSAPPRPPEPPAITTVITVAPDAPPPEPRGRTVVTETSIELLDPIGFVGNTAEVDPSSERIIAAIAETLNGNPSILLVQVRGHSDSTGHPAVRAELAGRRAQAVLEQLVAQGVAPDRLEVYGASDSERLYPVADPRNHRVELLVLERND
ncbi:MAG TPA: OmpA family protein [Kofleriaceae bacterium]